MPAFHNDAIQTGVAGGERMGSFGPPSKTRGIDAQPLGGREAAFARAKRRSARVRLWRVAILIGGLGAVSAMFVVAFFNPFATNLGALGFKALSVEVHSIVMDERHLAGFCRSGQP